MNNKNELFPSLYALSENIHEGQTARKTLDSLFPCIPVAGALWEKRKLKANGHNIGSEKSVFTTYWRACLHFLSTVAVYGYIFQFIMENNFNTLSDLFEVFNLSNSHLTFPSTSQAFPVIF